MKTVKKILKWILILILIPFLYLGLALILSFIPVGRIEFDNNKSKLIYLNTNGVHLDIIIPVKNIERQLLSGLSIKSDENFVSFGWGDKNFYINTPTWDDLTFANFCNAMFLKSSTLMHVTRHETKNPDWIEIEVSDSEFQKLNNYVQESFATNDQGDKIVLLNRGYSSNDDFYEARGSYSCFKTCNSWVNEGFKESGLTACLWTPFDFGLLNQYR